MHKLVNGKRVKLMSTNYSSNRIQYKVAIFALFSMASISVSNAQGNGYGQNSAPYNYSPPGPGQQAPDGSFVYGHPPAWHPQNSNGTTIMSFPGGNNTPPSNYSSPNPNNHPGYVSSPAYNAPPNQMHNRMTSPPPQGNGPTGMQAEIDRNVASMRARGIIEDRIKTYVESMQASPYAGGHGNYRMIAPGVKMYMNGMTPGQALSNVEHNGAVNNTIYTDGLQREWLRTREGTAPQLSH